MDVSKFLSTYWYVVVIIIIIVVVVLCCCCLCCYCRYKSTTSPGKPNVYYRRSVSPGFLESGSVELTNNSFKGKNHYPNVTYKRIECDGREDYPDRERPVTRLPHKFHDFVIQKIIPFFENQRIANYQFAVVLLLSESDFNNINWMSFIPSDRLGRPILNKSFPSMPQGPADYGNYLVARPSAPSCHSEEEIFGGSNSPFSRLWSSYVTRNGAYPQCILVYSWNLPCNRCTDVIIRSLGKEPYNDTSVIVAHTIVWRSETELHHEKSKEKLENENIKVQQVAYPERLPLGTDI